MSEVYSKETAQFVEALMAMPPALEAALAGLPCRPIGRTASGGRVEISAKQRPQLNEFSFADPGATVTFSLPQEN